tara:strand:+ start:706 stop:948 length:243 start_codon:yes stop_codon:yes gene_type:complete
MCIICVEFAKGKLKLREAVRNYGEIKETISPEHQKEVEKKLFNNFPFYPSQFDDYGFGREIDEVNDADDDEYWEKTGFGD